MRGPTGCGPPAANTRLGTSKPTRLHPLSRVGLSIFPLFPPPAPHAQVHDADSGSQHPSGQQPTGKYLAGEDGSPVKHEYLGGTVHLMAGATNRHHTIALNAAVHLAIALGGKSCRLFNDETKVRIQLPEPTGFYYPDAMLVCEPISPSDHFQDRPVVVIEVLSESTGRADMGEKRDAHRTIPSPNLLLLLLIEVETPAVTAYLRQAEGGFALETHDEPGAVVSLPEIGCELPLECPATIRIGHWRQWESRSLGRSG